MTHYSLPQWAKSVTSSHMVCVVSMLHIGKISAAICFCPYGKTFYASDLVLPNPTLFGGFNPIFGFKLVGKVLRIQKWVESGWVDLKKCSSLDSIL